MKSKLLLERYLAQVGKSNVILAHTDSDHLDVDAQQGHTRKGRASQPGDGQDSVASVLPGGVRGTCRVHGA